MIPLGWMLALLSVLAVSFLSDDAAQMVDVHSLILVTVVPLILILGVCGFQRFTRALKMALTEQIPDGDALTDCETTLAIFSRLTTACGSLATIMGFVYLLAIMDDPDKLLPKAGVVLLPLLYAVILAAFIIDPLRCRIWLKSNQTK